MPSRANAGLIPKADITSSLNSIQGPYICKTMSYQQDPKSLDVTTPPNLQQA